MSSSRITPDSARSTAVTTSGTTTIKPLFSSDCPAIAARSRPASRGRSRSPIFLDTAEALLAALARSGLNGGELLAAAEMPVAAPLNIAGETLFRFQDFRPALLECLPR